MLTTALSLASFVAPKLGKWLFGDDGETVANQVINVAQTLTGTTTPDAAKAALEANPELMVQFETAMANLDADLEKAYLADRQNARNRDIALAKQGRSNTRADLMVGAVVIGLIACIVVLGWMRDDIPGEVVGIISTVAGIFGSCLKDAFAFEFGSSRGSKEKDTLMASMGGKK
jgi:hypothetical protein